MIARGIAMWARVKDPDVRYEPCWKIDVLLEEPEAKRLKAAGIKVKRNDDDVFVLKVKRLVTKRKGTGNNPPPEVVDKQDKPFDTLIGNGSEVIVQFGVYTWKNTFGSGTGLDLQKIQVVNLVPYAGSTNVEDTEVIVPITDNETITASTSDSSNAESQKVKEDF